MASPEDVLSLAGTTSCGAIDCDWSFNGTDEAGEDRAFVHYDITGHNGFTFQPYLPTGKSWFDFIEIEPEEAVDG